MTNEETKKIADKIRSKYSDKEFGSIHVVRDIDYKWFPKVSPNWENRGLESVTDEGWRIELPHSCDEWVIGTVEDAEKFAKDLQEAIEYCKANP